MAINEIINFSIKNLNGETQTGSATLNLMVPEYFNSTTITDKSNYVIHRAFQTQSTNERQGTASTKTRAEVRGGGRKPWKQKGTDRARAGSNRSPLWKGGGVIFGPKPKKITLKSNKKERQLALQTLLYNKKNNILVIENLENAIVEPKTKLFLKVCQDCGVNLEEKVLV